MEGGGANGDGPTWGDEVWKDDDKVRTVAGQAYEPWKTFDICCGPWKFPNGLMQFLIDAGFKCPTPIQAHTWPVLMDSKDVIGVAKTGSGKTLGYLLPGYIKVKREEMKEGFSCDQSKGPAMLVMAPTRELCQQIYEESDRFGKPAQIRTACVFGGAPKGPQTKALWNGPQCVVATPGRLNDFLKDRSIRISQCCYLVLVSKRNLFSALALIFAFTFAISIVVDIAITLSRTFALTFAIVLAFWVALRS